MTRLFREGRTETVRSCTMETCAFVRSMIRDETVRLNSLIHSVHHTLNSLSCFLWLSLIQSDRRTSQVAKKGSRTAPKPVPPGNDRTRHRPSSLLSVCGLQIPGRRLCLPQGGMKGCRCNVVFCWLLLPVTLMWKQHTWCISGPVWALEAVHQPDSSPAGGAVWPGQTSRVRVFWRGFWSGR